MFYTFFINNKYDFEKNKIFLLDSTANFRGLKIIENGVNVLEIICDLFQVTISNNSKLIKFASEDYEVSLSYLLWFEVYYSKDGSSEKGMMQVIDDFIKIPNSQAILFSNGDKPILLKRSEKIIVDQHRLGTVDFPFEEMSVDYESGIINQI